MSFPTSAKRFDSDSGSYPSHPGWNAITRYMSGDCPFFALALHDVLGYEIVFTGAHLLGRDPDGGLWDVRGRHSPEAVAREFKVPVDDLETATSRSELVAMMDSGLFKCGLFTRSGLARAKRLLRDISE